MTVVKGSVRKVPRPAGVQLLKDLNNLHKESAQYGYFAEQKKHADNRQTGDQIGYADMMYHFEVNGVYSKEGLIKRRPFELAVMQQESLLKQGIHSALFTYFNTGHNAKSTLESVAKVGIAITKAYFGDSTKLPPNAQATIAKKGKDAPLVETGELVGNMAYKTSKQKGVRTT